MKYVINLQEEKITDENGTTQSFHKFGLYGWAYFEYTPFANGQEVREAIESIFEGEEVEIEFVASATETNQRPTMQQAFKVNEKAFYLKNGMRFTGEIIDIVLENIFTDDVITLPVVFKYKDNDGTDTLQCFTLCGKDKLNGQQVLFQY